MNDDDFIRTLEPDLRRAVMMCEGARREWLMNLLRKQAANEERMRRGGARAVQLELWPELKEANEQF